MYSWRSPSRITAFFAVVAGSIAMVSCSPDTTDQGSLTPPAETPNSVETAAAVKHDPLHRLGQGLAFALAEGSMRSWVHDQLRQSPFVEGRVPLREVLQKESRSAHIGKLLGRAGLTTAEVGGLASLELYFPIDEHRIKWSGGSDIQVAVQVGRTGSYAIYSARGGVKIVEEKTVPATPTLVLGPSEINYADAPSALRGGSRTGDGMRQVPASRLSEHFSPRMMFASHGSPAAWDTHLAISLRAFEIYKRHDGALSGADEIEIFGWLSNVGLTNTMFPECGYYTGITSTFVWFYQVPDRRENYLTTAVPTAGTSERLNLRMAEDDNEDCVYHSGDDDWLGSKAELQGPWNFERMYTMERPIGTTGHGSVRVVAVLRQ